MNASEGNLAARLAELESQVAFYEDTQGRLSDIVARQDREISTLGRQVEALRLRIREMAEALSDVSPGPDDERPPHY